MGCLALAAVAGFTSAFTTKSHNKNGISSRTYAVLGLTGSELSLYKVWLFTSGRCDYIPTETCSVEFSSFTPVSVIVRSVITRIDIGRYEVD